MRDDQAEGAEGKRGQGPLCEKNQVPRMRFQKGVRRWRGHGAAPGLSVRKKKGRVADEGGGGGGKRARRERGENTRPYVAT